MSTKDIENKLKELSKDNPNSSWKERKEYTKKNRAWLRKSVEIALKVLDVLEAKNMSQAELATKLVVSRQQISKIVKGQENLTLETISKLEDVLGVTLMVVPESETDNSFTAAVAVEAEVVIIEHKEIVDECEDQKKEELISFEKFLEANKQFYSQYQEPLFAGESNYAMAS
jgi:transcriptional regulator with XRE-family HTH domain